MARLIDADKLPVNKAFCIDEAGCGANFYVVDTSDIDDAPTAYDVDKVLEQLEEYDFNDVVLLTGYEESLIRLFKHNIIEIVRKGGVSE